MIEKRRFCRIFLLVIGLCANYTQIVYSHQKVDCMNGVELIFDEGARSVFLRLDPETSPITHQDVMRHLAAAGYTRFLVHPDEIDLAIAQHDAQADPFATGGDANSPALARIAEVRDAQLDVVLDESRMQATLRITAPWGGKAATIDSCQAALAAASVTQGIDNAAVNALVMQAANLDHGSTVEAVVARGTLPRNGEDSTFEVLVSTLKDRVLHPLQKADGSIDFHELGDIPVVREGDALMRRLPPSPGMDGVTVCGEVLTAAPGQCVAFTIGQGAQLSVNDPNLLIAQYGGMPAQLPCGMSVEKVFRTDEVSVKTGNVSFGGSILVVTDIKTGFAARADTDVTVGGVVESARVVAGNDVIVTGGISGHLGVKGTMPSAFVSAGNTVCTAFAQFAEIHANVGIVVTQFLLHCHLTSFNWIRMGGEAPGKSRLIGGSARALSFIKLDTVGSPDGSHTLIELAGDFERLANERSVLEKRISEREHQLGQVEVIMATLKAKTRFPHHAEMTQRALSARRNLTADLSLARQALAAWQQKHDQSCEKNRIVITRKAHAGCEFVIGDKRLVLTEDWGPGTVQYGATGLVLERGKVQL